MKNERYINIQKVSHGHYKITMEYYNKDISCITTNSSAIDDYDYNNLYEKEGRVSRHKRGYDALYSELTHSHKKLTNI